MCCLTSESLVVLAVGVEGVNVTSWQQVKSAGVANRDATIDYSSIMCCPIDEGGDAAPWYNCRSESLLATNYTEQFLAGASIMTDHPRA